MHLRKSGISIAPNISPAALHRAMARYGTGPDYPNGEQVLAFLNEDLPGGFQASYVVTDRRLIGRVHASNVSDSVIDIPFAYMVDLRLESGLLMKKLHVTLSNGRVERISLFVDPLHGLLSGLMQMPPQARAVALTPPQPTAEDPSGAMGSLMMLIARDPRPTVLLRALHEATRRGQIPQHAAVGLAARAVFLDRTIASGRGSRMGYWLSELSRAELALFFQAMFDAPMGNWREPTNETFDFAFNAGGGRGPSAASAALGLALFATVGVGWRSQPQARHADVRVVRAIVTDLPPQGGFGLLGSSGAQFFNLSIPAASVVEGLSEALLGLEARRLIGEIALGPNDPLNAPIDAVQARIAELLGPGDLSTFYA
jgi:hypothetical protein